MRRHVLRLIGVAYLSGCAGGDSEVVCPQMRPYSPEVQSKAADELDALPEGSVILVFMGDYAVMREELRAGGCGV